MAFIVLIFGAVLLVAALRGTQGTLASALMQDVPSYVTWAMAIVAVGCLGFLPKVAPASRALMTLIIVVIFLKNYQKVISGFEGAAKTVAPTITTSAASGSSGSGGVNVGSVVSSATDYAALAGF
jgi:hypothetical protein